MTEFFKFAAECPLIACFIVVAIGVTLVDLAKFGMVSINRICRHWTLRKNGYPPAHCDADGDFKP